MAKKNIDYVQFNAPKASDRKKVVLQFNGKDYKLKTDILTANKVIKIAESLDEAEEFEVLDNIFNILNLIYGPTAVDEFAEVIEDTTTWMEFLEFSIEQMKEGMVKGIEDFKGNGEAGNSPKNQ